MSSTAVIALGSNQGDRRAHLHYAVDELARVLSGLRVSSFVESRPLPPASPEDPCYLNAVAVGLTDLAPRDLLLSLLGIERARGRTRPFPGAPRTLDLDLILLGNSIVEAHGLVLPHPRFRERRFVLEPLAELAPHLVDPVTGLAIRDLLERCRS